MLVTLAHAQQTGMRQPPAGLQALEETLLATLKTSPTAANWEKLGLSRHLQNRFEEAIPAFREAVRLDPSLWTSHLFLGIGLYRTNQFTGAMTALERADNLSRSVRTGRDDVDYWLAATAVALKQPLRALRSIEQLLQRNPNHLEALELAVRTYRELSTGIWNDIADKHFETAAGYEIHGHALESEGNRKGAIEAFRRSRALDPKRAGPGLAISRLLLLEGHASQSLAELERELRLPEADPTVYYYAGLAAIDLARYAEAAAWLETAARSTVQNPDAPLALAQVYLALKQPARAAEAARRAVDVDPSSAAARQLLKEAEAALSVGIR